MFRDDGSDAPYTATQLTPTIQRLRRALDSDFGEGRGTPQGQLAAAWTRVAELRLPRKAVPATVLAEIEDLLLDWDRFRPDGIRRYAMSLSDDAVAQEKKRIERMLEETLRLAALDYTSPTIPSE